MEAIRARGMPVRHDDYLVDEFQMRVPLTRRSPEGIKAFFSGVRCALFAYSTWRDGEQFTAMGRNVKDVVTEINASERLALDMFEGETGIREGSEP